MRGALAPHFLHLWYHHYSLPFVHGYHMEKCTDGLQTF